MSITSTPQSTLPYQPGTAAYKAWQEDVLRQMESDSAAFIFQKAAEEQPENINHQIVLSLIGANRHFQQKAAERTDACAKMMINAAVVSFNNPNTQAALIENGDYLLTLCASAPECTNLNQLIRYARDEETVVEEPKEDPIANIPLKTRQNILRINLDSLRAEIMEAAQHQPQPLQTLQNKLAQAEAVHARAARISLMTGIHNPDPIMDGNIQAAARKMVAAQIAQNNPYAQAK